MQGDNSNVNGDKYDSLYNDEDIGLPSTLKIQSYPEQQERKYHFDRSNQLQNQACEQIIQTKDIPVKIHQEQLDSADIGLDHHLNKRYHYRSKELQNMAIKVNVKTSTYA